jgi:hypothetical protein
VDPKSFMKALREARYVFVWVNIWREDGAYVKTSKAEIKAIVSESEYPVAAELRESGDLYIG